MKKTINTMNAETRKLITDLRLHYIKRDNLNEKIRYDYDRLEYEESIIPGFKGKDLSQERTATSGNNNQIENHLIKIETIKGRIKGYQEQLHIVERHIEQANKILATYNDDYQKVLFKKYGECKKNWVIAQETYCSLGSVKKIVSKINRIFYEDVQEVNAETEVLSNSEIKKHVR